MENQHSEINLKGCMNESAFSLDIVTRYDLSVEAQHDHSFADLMHCLIQVNPEMLFSRIVSYLRNEHFLVSWNCNRAATECEIKLVAI